MKRTFLSTISLIISLGLLGCGHDHIVPPRIVTQILSDPSYDGDIARDPNTSAFTITQGNTQSVFAGIDPATGTEYRAFLDFPLTGAGGFPCNSGILSATLDLFINSILPQPLNVTIPIRIDLVAFQPPTLLESDYDRSLQPALATTTIIPEISQGDFGQHVYVDVTSLMNAAQHICLENFQIRILEDIGIVSPGLIEINDTTGPYRAYFAPLLQVEYY